MSNNQSICMLSIDDRTLTTDLDRAGYRSMGVFVRAANNYEAAEKILQLETIHLIVINMDYSSINALEITKHLKKHDKWKSIPIVLTSVQTKAKIRSNALAAGADLFVEQPLPRQYFIEKLKQLLEQQTRTTERIDINGKVNFVYENKNYSCEMADLSISGILLSTDLDLSDGAIIQMSFELPGLKKPIEAEGEVVRRIKAQKASPDGQATAGGVGVRFTKLDKESERRLEKYIAKTSDKNSKIIYYL